MITSRWLAVASATSAVVLATTWMGGGAAVADTPAPSPTPSSAPASAPTPSPGAPALAERDLSRLVRTDGPADLGTTTLGLKGWRVVSTATEHGSGSAVSQTGHSTRRWLAVKPDDGGAPGTEINALLQNGACPKVFYSDNLKKCFGTQETGPETVKRFAVPWWYRTTFATPKHGDHAELITNGVVGEADVWVNGTRVATRSTITGAYTQHRLDVSRLLRAKGGNTVAIKVYPNDPLKYFTVSNIDWTQIPPDQNTGIQFPVQLQSSAGVELSDSHVVQRPAADLTSTRLTVSAKVTNVTGHDAARDRRRAGRRPRRRGRTGRTSPGRSTSGPGPRRSRSPPPTTPP